MKFFKKIIGFLSLIIVVIIAKIIGSVSGTSMGEIKNEKTALERFVNEFVINNTQLPTPYRLNENTILLKKTLIKKDGVLFVVDHYKIEEKRENLGVFSDNEIRRSLTEQTRLNFCAGLKEMESLFTGYSTVGLVSRSSDINGNPIFEFSVDKSMC